MGKNDRRPKAPQEGKSADAALALANTKLNATAKKKFMEVLVNPKLNWESERTYVFQILERNEFLAKVFMDNPASAITALQDAAALGLSLSPTLELAYLIPRRPAWDKPFEVQLKVSYKGMEQAVLASGAVTGINTQLVYANDKFEFGANENGPFMVFSMARGDRGDLDGVFCQAIYSNGFKHIEWMPMADLEACHRAAIEANGKKDPPAWSGDFKPEMQKKCCVRRAAKHWPSNPVIERVMREFDKESPMVFGAREFNDTFDASDYIGDEQIAELDSVLSALSDKQRAVWYQRKAQAEGFDDIRSVPLIKFEKFRDDLLARMNQMMQLTDASKQTIQPVEEKEHDIVQGSTGDQVS